MDPGSQNLPCKPDVLTFLVKRGTTEMEEYDFYKLLYKITAHF